MRKRYYFFLFIFSTAIVSFWFRSGLLMGTAESGLPFYSLENNLLNTQWAWSSYIIGSPAGHTTATAPLYFAFFSLGSLGASTVLLEYLFFLVSVYIAFIGMSLFTKLIFPNLEEKHLLIGALFYAANPLSMANVWHRFLYNYTLFWAALPLLAYLFTKGVFGKNYKYSLAFSLFTAIFSYALSAPALVIVLWIFVSSIALFEFVLTSHNRIFLVKYFLLSILLFSVVNIWWLSQMVLVSIDSLPLAEESGLFTASGNLEVYKTISDRLGNLTSIFRSTHETHAISGPYPLRIYSGIGRSTLGFLFVFIPILYAVRLRKSKNVLLILFLFFVSIFLMKGSNRPLGMLSELMFSKIFLLQFIRNSFEKIGFIYALLISGLFAFSFFAIRNKLSQAIVIFLLALWTMPFWRGEIFQTEIRGDIFDYQVAVPEYYKDINKIITDGESRILHLPIGGEGMSYTWENSYTGVELSRDLFKNPSVSFNTSVPFYTDYATKIEESQLTEEFLDYVSYLNIRYIVLRFDIDYKSRGLPNPKDIERLLDRLVERNDLEYIGDYGQLKLYEVSSEIYWPKFYLTNRVIHSNTSDLSETKVLDNSFPNAKNVVFDFSSLSDNDTESIVVTPSKTYTPLVPGAHQNYSDQELIDQLFFIKHLPGSSFYKIALFKERLETPREDESREWLRYKVGLLGKRVSELYMLYENKANEDLILSAEDRFNYYLQELSGQNVRDKENINSLLSQLVLLDRVGSKSSHTLATFLEDLDLKPKHTLPENEENIEYLIYKFNVPMDGEYRLMVDSILENAINIYINGEVMSPDDIRKGSMFSQGEIELAFEIDSSLLTQEVYSLEKLSATNHESESILLSLDSNTSYRLISRDFIKMGKIFDLSISSDINKNNYPFYKVEVSKNPLHHGPVNSSRVFKTPIGSKDVEISIKPGLETKCEKSWWGRSQCDLGPSEYEVEFSNISVQEILNPNVSLVAGSEISSDKTTTVVSWDKRNPTRYVLSVNKQSEDLEYLVFSEMYNSGWRAYYLDSGDLLHSHRKANHYANSWAIDRKGEYTVIVEYKLQKYLELASIVSIFSFISGSLYLISKYKS